MSWVRIVQLLTREDLPPEWFPPEPPAPPPVVLNPCSEIPLEGYLTPRRVVFPLFEIVSNPTIPLTAIRERRFDLIERSQELSRATIQASEDERIFEVLDSLAEHSDPDLTWWPPHSEVESDR